jgi:hypothetical protein
MILRTLNRGPLHGYAMGEHPGEIAGWDLRTHTRAAERYREAGRGCSDARDPDGAGPVHTAVVVAGDDDDLAPLSAPNEEHGQ